MSYSYILKYTQLKYAERKPTHFYVLVDTMCWPSAVDRQKKHDLVTAYFWFRFFQQPKYRHPYTPKIQSWDQSKIKKKKTKKLANHEIDFPLWEKCTSGLCVNFSQQSLWRKYSRLNCTTHMGCEVMDKYKRGLESRSLSVYLRHYSGNKRSQGKESGAQGSLGSQ